MITFIHDGDTVEGFPTDKFMRDSFTIDLHGHTIKGKSVGHNYMTQIPISPLGFREQHHTTEYPDLTEAIVTKGMIEMKDDWGTSYIFKFDGEDSAFRKTMELCHREKLFKSDREG